MNLWLLCWFVCSLSPTRGSVTELSGPNSRRRFKSASPRFSIYRFPSIGCDPEGSFPVCPTRRFSYNFV